MKIILKLEALFIYCLKILKARKFFSKFLLSPRVKNFEIFVESLREKFFKKFIASKKFS